MKKAEKQAFLSALRDYAGQGWTREQAADALGVSYAVVIHHSNKNEIKFRRKLSEHAKQSGRRARDMAAMYQAGKTLQEIGSVYSLTRERVRQLIKKHTSMTAVDGGIAIRARRARETARIQREAECLRKHGCTTSQLNGLRKIGHKMRAAGAGRERTPIGAFGSQRQNARRRDIEWNLKLWEWWALWQESGHWGERGRGADLYVMCRFGDTGPYEIGNVYIATLRHNSTVQPNNPNRRAGGTVAEARA